MMELLCKMREGCAESSIVFIHPITGSIIPYVKISQIMKVRSGIYAMCDPMTVGLENIPGSVTGRAIIYADIISDSILGNCLTLAGWSMGGLFALETARVLKSRGVNTSVVMIDSCLDISGSKKIAGEISLERKLDLFMSDILASRAIAYDFGKIQLQTFDDAINILNDYYEFNVSQDAKAYLQKVFAAFSSNTVALSEYIPSPYDELVYHIVANKKNDNVYMDKDYWEHTITRNSRFSFIDSDHYCIVNNPEMIAELILSACQKIENKHERCI